MKYNKLLFSLLLLAVFCFSCKEEQKLQTSLDFDKVLLNAKSNPIAIESESPLFSWIIKAEGFGKSQSAYHILVASSLDKLDETHADVWNSNKVESSKSTFVKYEGKELKAATRYYWKVKVWDKSNQESNWSEPQYFQMGLLDESNWGEAKWITLTNDTRTSEYRFREYKTGRMEQPIQVDGFAASYFRNKINLNKEVDNAQVYICGLGYYEFFLNGEKVGDHVLDPAPSNYDKQAYYVNYDITEQLNSGENALGIILGNGFYGQNISWKNDPESDRDLAYGPPTVRVLLKLKYKDGTESEFFSDETWKESTGPIVFNNIYGGDTYDARFELGDWTSTNYDDSSWGFAKETAPEIKNISAQQIPAIKKLQDYEPQNVFKGSDGEWIVDFGQNIAGWVKLNVSEKEGQLIEVITTEALLTNGRDIFPGSTGGGANGMAQIYQYICKGDGQESWEPKFSYHGFRYAKIKGVSTKPDADMIKAVLVATDIQETGSFECSDDLFNKMHNISKWTIVDNVHGIPEDCPHREKCGWLGDAHAFCEYALYNYDMYDFYKKYMEDIRTQMLPTKGHNNPELKFQVPTMIAPGKRTSSYAKIDWGVATMYLPWYNYLYYGDDAIVNEYYPEMKDLTNFYLNFKGENGIMQDGMGDWCPPRWDRRTNPEAMECDPIISANAYFYDVLGIMETFAKMNNDGAFQSEMKAEKEALKDAFNKAFLVEIPNTDFKWYQSQTATVQALQFGMVPEEEIENVVNGLEYDIVEVKGGHHSTGIHGNRYIYTVLSKYGKADLAYRILTTPDFPSQTYIMNSGFTTWPERQFEWETMEGPTNSLNHPMHSGFSAYFFESLGGIKSSTKEAGYKQFIVNPEFPSQITQTKVSVPTPYGDIKNDWSFEEGKLSMTLEIPFNTEANLVLNQAELESLIINGKTFQNLQKNTKSVTLQGSNVILGSGKYKILYNKR
ncbi:alpha-L-rhamnosidase (GH78) [Formosa agariphila KMM 3901]|uniref:Alpha-L-rhamnosidase n=1 Tax=Formosa agariphila (strain DSM 15362 / KCTC 12365 / LMG 23005 / KMM 3901 / M-2Alg 35-1) TaxID=1347342 RepID=PLH28_FORAG|nr:alpha-L-rhamnosidase [Formosa agariphila]T2KPL4.1 RecName: Full=Alpha-L-rhamnosidase; AltName: Full=Glycosyl hydrolase 78 family protein P28; Short=P28_GH78; AltName: Full=Polysaccharide utilization locus H protein P28; Short=PUL H protein P28; Flags: Precursor [Formosa agariphila KMM 3901]CDF79929.1 alpha-L-rhamnosidase (GH78) [Formosa agariphila KMM 3901]